MEQVYKINQIVLNDTKSQFGICFNNGIKTFNTDDFKVKYYSSPIGNISLMTIVHELNIVVFVGSETNEIYNSKKIVIYDLISQKDIYSTPFQREITRINTINKFLVIGFQNELKIFSLEKKDTLIPINEITLDSDLYEFWSESSNELSLTKIYLANFSPKDSSIFLYIGNDWNFDKPKNYKIPVSKIQNIFFVKKLNQIIIPDETAYYIYGINVDDGKQTLCLYRGRNPGIITSVVLLNKNYLAINNLNRKIYIYDIEGNNNNYNIGNYIGGLIYGNYISSFMVIPYDKIIEEKEGEFYQADFQKKGAVLSCEDQGIELKIFAFNGVAYKLRINFLKKEFEILLKEKFAKYKIEQMEENTINDSDLYSSYNSIFDNSKKKEKKEENKFVFIQ